jgi:hypothetical protein
MLLQVILPYLMWLAVFMNLLTIGLTLWGRNQDKKLIRYLLDENLNLWKELHVLQTRREP